MKINRAKSVLLIVLFCLFSVKANDAILTLNSPSTSSPSQIIFESSPYNATFKAYEDSSFALQKGTNDILSYNATSDTLRSDYNLELGSSLGLSSGSNNLQFQGINQWKLWVNDDFEDNASRQGWSQTQIATCGNSPNVFLGILIQFVPA